MISVGNNPILCVDDEPANLELLRHILGNDYKLSFAINCEMALKAIEKLNPTLILMDVHLPDKSGYDFVAELKTNPAWAHIPVIFVTASSDLGSEEKGFAVGGVDFIKKPYHPEILKHRIKLHLSLVQSSQLNESYKNAIGMLGIAGHWHDPTTGSHIWRMANYARALGQAIGLSKEQADILHQAAPLHDVGKIGVNPAIVRKNGSLTDDEWDEMKNHTIIGYEILQQSEANVFKVAADIALRHHEKWDGSGYPGGLAGDHIPLCARIVAVADVYDALTTERPYKSAWSHNDAIEELKLLAGTHLDPELVAVFAEISKDF